MIIRIVKMTFKADKTAEFETLFNQYKNEIANQPGCKKLSLMRDINQPEVFMTYSHWDNEESLNAYRKSETFGIVWPRTKALFANNPEAWSVTEHTQVK